MKKRVKKAGVQKSIKAKAKKEHAKRNINASDAEMNRNEQK